MLEDSKGYMWFGTENGLTRYDGKELKVYEHDDLMSYDFNSIHEDSKGNIWSHNFANQVVQIRDDSLMVYEDSVFTKQGYYMEMVMGETDNIYIKVRGHLIRYIPKRDTFSTIFENPEGTLSFLAFADGILATLKIDGDGILKCLRYDEVREKPDTIHILNRLPKHIRTYQVTRDTMLMSDATGITKDIYTIRRDSIVVYESLKKYNLPETFKVNNIKLLEGDLWYFTTKGAVRQKDGQILLPGVNTANMMMDDNGNTWISSLKEGVFILPNLNIELYNAINSDFPVSAFTSITFDEEGNLFAGTTEGRVVHWDINRKKILKEYDTGIGVDISDVFYNEATQCLWTSGIFQFKKGQEQYEQAIIGGAMKQAFAMGDEILIRSSRETLFHLNQKNIRQRSPNSFSPNWEPYKTRGGEGYKLSRNFGIINTIHYDTQKDEIWIATSNNTIINSRTGLDTFFLDNKTPLAARCFEQISGENQLWVGARQGGFIILKDKQLYKDKRNEQYKAYGEIRLIRHGGNRVWLLAEDALLVTDREGEILSVYTTANGIQINDVTDMAIGEDKAWLCTNNGLLSIHYKENILAKPPKPIVTNVYVQGKPQKHKTAYIFPHDQNTIQINFRSISNFKRYFNYRYRLGDLEEGWDTVQTEFARYPGLSPDVYTFEVQALGMDGQTSETLRIDFDIEPPFWKNRWFIILSVLFMAGILYFTYRKRIKYLERRSNIRQQLRSSQLTALRSQMNPHFLFNSLNSIQEFIILNEKKLANEYLSKFSRLMRVYLNHSAKDSVRLSEETEALKVYLELEKLRFEHIQIKLTIDPLLNSEDIHIPPLFVQPYVENAFKHGLFHKKNNRKLDIFFTKKNVNTLEIIIEDNGIGRAKAKQIKQTHSSNNDSFATSANEQRLNLLNYNKENFITVNILDLSENNIATGTKVIIQIPINHHYE